jgi:hypothetical protein
MVKIESGFGGGPGKWEDSASFFPQFFSSRSWPGPAHTHNANKSNSEETKKIPWHR